MPEIKHKMQVRSVAYQKYSKKYLRIKKLLIVL